MEAVTTRCISWSRQTGFSIWKRVERERSQGFWPLQLEEQSFCQLTLGWNGCGWKVPKRCLHMSSWRCQLDIPVEIERRYSEIMKPEPKGEAGTRGVNVGVRA